MARPEALKTRKSSKQLHEDKRSSLDRLKTLDELPNVDAQLAAASSLCNHAHRAEMITKWLSEKLRKEQSYRENLQAWLLLKDCLRLLSISRIVTLLGNISLIDLVTQTLGSDHGDSIPQLLSSIKQLFDVLLAIAASADAAPLRRILDVPSTQAALFFRSWTTAVISTGNDAVSTQGLLEPAFQIWSRRRPSSDDNDMFVEHCYFPAALLLDACAKVDSAQRSQKRRRSEIEGQADLSVDVTHHLQSLVAEHVFLDSRTHFFSQSSLSGSSRSEVRPEGDRPRVVFQASVLGKQMRSNSVTSDPAFLIIPILLDVAIRCVPITTQRQRLRELPWIEAVFHALLQECWIACKGDEKSRGTLLEMLDVVKKRASLPFQALQNLVLAHSGLAEDVAEADIDWPLIAKVAELNSDVYIEDSLANPLFTALTAGCETSPELRSDGSMRYLLQNMIAIPVMQAFARNRRLPNFITRWATELDRQSDPDRWSVWLQLDVQFADLLETHLSAQQIEQEFDSRVEALIRAKAAISEGGSTGDEVALEAHPSLIVVLSSLLLGIQSDEVPEQLQYKLESLTADFESICDISPVICASAPRFSVLAMRLFDLSFPRWALRQASSDLVKAGAMSWLSSPMGEAAFTSTTVSISSTDLKEQSARSAQDAALFIGRLCEALYNHGNCINLATAHVQRLVQLEGSPAVTVFIKYPTLLTLVGESDYPNLLDGVYSAKSLGKSASLVEAFTEVAILSSSLWAERIVSRLADHLAADGTLQTAEAAMNVILGIPTLTLTRIQRERLLNILTSKKFLRRAQSNKATLDKDHAVIVHLMQSSNMTADLSTDVKVIWQLNPVVETSRSNATTSQTSNIDLVLKITRLTLHHLLAAQDQEKIRTMLQALHHDARDKIYALLTKQKARMDAGTMSIALSVLRSIHSGLKEQYQTAFTESLRAKSSQIIELATEEIKRVEAPDETLSEIDRYEAWYSALFDVVLTLNRISPTLVEGHALLAKKYNETLHAPLDLTSVARREEAGLVAPAVHRLRLKAETPSSDPIDIFFEARKLVSGGLTLKEHELTLDAFSRTVATGGDGKERTTMLDVIMDQIAADVSPASLLLLQKALVPLAKADSQDDHNVQTMSIPIEVLATLRSGPSYPIHKAGVACILFILREKPFLITQYAIETTLLTVHHLAAFSPAEPLIFPNLCAMLTVLLTHHRSRLNGRFHILVPVLQALLQRLLAPARRSPAEKDRALGPQHAQVFARVLTLLCDPPQSRYSKQKQNATHNNLVDQTRRTRAAVGSFIAPFLHSYCAFVLRSPPREGIEGALAPGLWAVLGAMEVSEPEAIKVLSAAMNNSERAVLRSVVEEWRVAVRKWSGV